MSYCNSRQLGLLQLRQRLLQFTIAGLLQFSTTVITIFDRYYNSRRHYFNLRQNMGQMSYTYNIKQIKIKFFDAKFFDRFYGGNQLNAASKKLISSRLKPEFSRTSINQFLWFPHELLPHRFQICLKSEDLQEYFLRYDQSVSSFAEAILLN